MINIFHVVTWITLLVSPPFLSVQLVLINMLFPPPKFSPTFSHSLSLLLVYKKILRHRNKALRKNTISQFLHINFVFGSKENSLFIIKYMSISPKSKFKIELEKWVFRCGLWNILFTVQVSIRLYDWNVNRPDKTHHGTLWQKHFFHLGLR